MPARFGAVLCAMVTPFDEKGLLDRNGAARLARWLLDNGNDGLVVAGTTGEAPVLSDEERLELLRAVRAAVAAPVIAGTGTASTQHSIELTKAAAAAGADAVLAVTPYYNRPSQAGIEAHFRAIAGASHLPVIAYDIPRRTGREIKAETMLKLAAEGVLVGLKDAAGSPAATAALIARAPAGFEVYSGDDSMTLPLLAVGAVGVISVASHWAGREMSEMVTAFAKGDTEAARALNARLIDSWEYQSSDDAPSPVPTKAMLGVLGLPGGGCRLPMGPVPPGLAEHAREVWARLRGQQVHDP
ncbi:MAG TPA: 4-hydroxy-tetrahydrodipicolinate synthase [Acidimicrobiales bacterium]|nr:4-hydroxy-tetrahydrodipicolinate synthase [Acidimicrobiales bacterium]